MPQSLGPMIGGLCLLLGGTISISAHAENWSQWRGPNRDGHIQTDQTLLTELPEQGLQPVWFNTEDFAGNGGWSSPVVADGFVYVYCHARERREGVTLPPPKYPNLSEEDEAKLTNAERQQYDEKRRQESIERQKKLYQVMDRVVCLNAETGEQLWKSDRPSAPTRWRQSSTPTVTKKAVVYVGADRQLVTIGRDSGEIEWATPIPLEKGDQRPICSSPLAVDGLIVVMAERLVAFDQTSGSFRWKSEFSKDNAIHSSPVAWQNANGSRVLVNVPSLGVVCVDAQTGNEQWRIDSGGGQSTPIIAGDKLVTYATSRKGGLRCYRLSEDGPELEWMYRRISDQGSSPVVVGNRVYAQGGADFVCVNLEDGELIWQGPIDQDRPRFTSPIAVGDSVFYTFGGVMCVSNLADEFAPLYDARISEDGTLTPVEAIREKLGIAELEKTADGQLEALKLWKTQVTRFRPRDCVSPAFVDGRLYLRTNQGVVCYSFVKS
ncbi:PQQ-binding-like beta-propeller repeat protein [Thalassoroseus pseudoceratinae]|uniref:PQQ-binding-like beta-propeller repeat protein n=1 Tax=Thalassoroseus pseudoceratinae TaxID=2713176 RepID=UPI00141F3B43|nr:PQQ-binding-like beta-propeller repeat protein [Thalassoroseus pseudoceratinae]